MNWRTMQLLASGGWPYAERPTIPATANDARKVTRVRRTGGVLALASPLYVLGMVWECDEHLVGRCPAKQGISAICTNAPSGWEATYSKHKTALLLF